MTLRARTTPFLLAISLVTSSLTSLAVDDVPATDPKPMLQALKVLREQQLASAKSSKQRFIQEAMNAAGNPARAVELWEEAIRATQFQGAAKENAQFREWKEKDGEAFKDREVLSALHLYFQWLALSLQRANGVENKTLLPAVLTHAREVQADQLAMDAFEENLKRAKEVAQNAPRKPNADREKEKRRDDEATKRVHDQILRGGVGGSPFVQWMRLGDILNDVAPARRGGRGGNGGAAPATATASQPQGAPAEEAPRAAWEASPGNYDGIYQQIILPELRALKDVRVLEYWDTKIRRETDLASKAKLAFDVDKFNTVRRPQLVWSRSLDLVQIGQKNRGINDMFALIKATPLHPDADNWIAELESILAPPSASVVNSPLPAPAAEPVAGQ